MFPISVEPRQKILFDFDWRFHRGEAAGAEKLGHGDGGWRKVDLPHDWSIEDIPAGERKPFLRFQKGNWKFAKGDKPAWKQPDLDDSRWQTITAPANWRQHSNYTKKDAWGWYRRELVLPSELQGRDFVLDMGLVGEINEVFLNGKSIGRTGSFPPRYKPANWWMPLSRYEVKAAWLKKDRPNMIAVRVFSKMGKEQTHCAFGRGGLLEDSPEGEAKGPFDPLSVSSWATGYAVGGRGWYRKSFKVPASWKGKRLHLNFDGVYMNSRVWFNGKLLATQPYGYSSFDMELPQPRWGKDNVVSVQVRNDGFNSRWYTGSGIYRHVWLTVTEPLHIAHRGTCITTNLAGTRHATVNVGTSVVVPKGGLQVLVKTTLRDPKGRQVAESQVEVACRKGSQDVQQKLELDAPDLWSVETPRLYTARTQLFLKGRLVDSQDTPFGIRSIDFSAEAGFRLNGKKTLLKGGCMHHDNGILGSRAFDAAEERRIRVMKENGFNAVRTSHNPPSESFLEACDRLGFLVLDEAFDQWEQKTNEYDYHRYHADWWKKDMRALVMRDRNHPSVIMWSIGNEIGGKEKPATERLAHEQAEFVRALDPSRPVTEGVNGVDKLWIKLDSYIAAHDVPGYNYMERWYEKDHARVPERVMYQSESSNQRIFESCMAMLEKPYVVGDFVWTGYDYIGEAGIGYNSFDVMKRENRMWTLAYCGDLDLCGHKRPQSYYREAIWGTGPKISAMVHSPSPTFGPRNHGTWGYEDVHPHWTWPGWEGKKLTVDVYTRCEKVELRLNGRLIGSKKVDRASKFKAQFKVPYKAGTLVANGFIDGKKAATWTMATAGKPAGLRLRAEKALLKADGQDLAFLHLEVVDRLGRRVPHADNPVEIVTSGSASLAGLGTGHPQNLDSFQDSVHNTFEGRAMLVLRAGKSGGQVKVRALSPGLKPATLSLRVK